MSGALVAQAINESVGTPGFRGIDAILKEYLGLIAEQAGTARVPISRTINGHSLASDVDLTNDDVGAAPAGFGLGSSSVICSDVDAAVDNGFYYTTAATANKPFDSVGWFVVSNRVNTDCVVQTYYIYEGNNATILVRKKNYSKVWGEWEWVNPPMQVGVEYRTTERWQGKPVYVEWLSVGWLPDNSEIKVIVDEEINEIFHMDGYTYSQSGDYSTTFTASDTISVGYRKSTKELTVTTSFPYATQGRWGAVAFIKYIK